MSLPTRRLSTRLADLAVGQRFWFWLCPDATVPLAISSMSEDPDTFTLSHETRRIWRPRGAAAVFGIGDVSPTGHITLAAQGATREQLEGLAGWVSDHFADNPEMGRLSGAALLKVDAKLAVLDRYDDPTLWTGLPVVPAEGTTAAADAILTALPVHGSAWLWAAIGDGGEATLLVSDGRSDVEQNNIKRLVRTALSRGITTDQILMGVAIRRSEGTIMLRTRSDEARALLRDLRKAFPGLTTLKQIRIKEQDETDLSSEVIEIVQLNPGDHLWFSFSTENGGSLVLATERKTLRERARIIQQGAPLSRGQLYLDPRGWFELQIKSPSPELLPAFAGWVLTNNTKWPATRRFLNTRLTVRDADGRVTERLRDDTLWSQN